MQSLQKMGVKNVAIFKDLLPYNTVQMDSFSFKLLLELKIILYKVFFFLNECLLFFFFKFLNKEMRVRLNKCW